MASVEFLFSATSAETVDGPPVRWKHEPLLMTSVLGVAELATSLRRIKFAGEKLTVISFGIGERYGVKANVGTKFRLKFSHVLRHNL